MKDRALRDHVVAMLGWEDAHAGFEQITEGVPADKWGALAPGLPYSLWQLLEHLRLAQHDILDFCVDPRYAELKWPDDYWPAEPEPPSPQAWDGSVRQIEDDLRALERLAVDPSVDLLKPIPHGSGQTILRELLLVIDHNSYHVGQIVALRRVLGAWPPR